MVFYFYGDQSLMEKKWTWRDNFPCLFWVFSHQIFTQYAGLPHINMTCDGKLVDKLINYELYEHSESLSHYRSIWNSHRKKFVYRLISMKVFTRFVFCVRRVFAVKLRRPEAPIVNSTATDTNISWSLGNKDTVLRRFKFELQSKQQKQTWEVSFSAHICRDGQQILTQKAWLNHKLVHKLMHTLAYYLKVLMKLPFLIRRPRVWPH